MPRRASRSKSRSKGRRASKSKSRSRSGQRRAQGLGRGRVTKTAPRTSRERALVRRLERSHSRGDRRGELTRGWSVDKPTRISERRAIAAKCSNINNCFLEPERLKYVVCARNSCKPDPRGTLEAFQRARQHGRQDIAAKAIALGKKNNHAWALKH